MCTAGRLSTELRRRSCCCCARSCCLCAAASDSACPDAARPLPCSCSAEGCREPPPPPSLRMAASVYCAKAERRLEPSRDALAWSEGPVPGVPCAGRPWLMESSAAASAASACCAAAALRPKAAAAPPPREEEERPWRLALPARSRSMLLSARLSPPPPECAPRLVLLDCGPLLCAAPPGCCAAAALAAAAFLFACRRLRLHCNVAISGQARTLTHVNRAATRIFACG